MKKTAKNDYVTVARVVDNMTAANETALLERIRECEIEGYERVGEEPEDMDEFEIWGDELNSAIEEEWDRLGHKDFYGFSYAQWLTYNWMVAN